MGMNKGGYFSFHGGKLHNLVIFLIWYKLINNGWRATVQDRGFLKFNCPSIPDIVAKKAKPEITNYIIEVETKMTATSTRRKWKLFIEEIHGYDLLIVNLDDIENVDSVGCIEKYLESVLP
jgi:hypothetical protein